MLLISVVLFPAIAFVAEGQAFSDTPPLSETPGALSLNNRNLLILAGLGTAAYFAKTNEDDAAMRRTLDRSGLDFLIDTGNQCGDGIPLGIGAVGLMMSGRMFENPRLSQSGHDMAKSLIWSGTLVWGLKVAINSERPNGGPYSFPSGHTASAFAVAPVIGHHYGRGAGVAAYTLAAGTAMGRMEENRHHLADVLFGAAIGLTVGLEVIKDCDHYASNAETDGKEETGGPGGITGFAKSLLDGLNFSSSGIGLAIRW